MANEVEEFVRRFGKVPKEIKRELRPGLRAAGKEVADEAKRRSSWSTTIPRATRISVTFAGRRQGVSVVVDRKKAPSARPYEHGGSHGVFRAPLFGDRDHWYPHRARPFLAPALRAKGDDAAGKIADVVNRVIRDHT